MSPLLRSNQQQRQRRPTILLIGDSLTQLGFGSDPFGTTGKNASPYPAIGWASLLAVTYSRRADIINRGFRGYTSSMLLRILPQILNDLVGNIETTTDNPPPGQPPPSNNNIPLVTIWLGANDYVRAGPTTTSQQGGEYVPSISDQRHVPPNQFRQNLMDIIALVRQRLSPQNGASQEYPKIILFTLPPLHQSKFEQYTRSLHDDRKLRSLRTNQFAKEYGDIIKQVAKECNCSLVDVFEILNGNSEGAETEFSKYLVDGLHLTQQGNAKVYEGLMDVIQKEYPQLSPIIPTSTSTTNVNNDNEESSCLVPLEFPQWQDLME